MRDGIHKGLSFDEYAAIDAVNNSLLSDFDRSAAHGRQRMLHPKDPSPAMVLGQAVHAAVLEPEKFKAEYVVAPKLDKRTGPGKKAWADFEEANKARIVLTDSESRQCSILAAAVRAHPLAAELLASKGMNEVSAVWTDKQTGLRCKARIDRLCSFVGYSVALDLKTCQNASPDEWPKQMARFKYHRQAAWYLWGLDVLASAERRFFHLAVEKDPPNCVAVYEPDDETLARGQAENERALARFARCKRDNEWPGYGVGIEPVSLPRWAMQIEEVG